MEFAYKMNSELKFNQADVDDCFDFFNPVTESDYNATLIKWTNGI